MKEFADTFRELVDFAFVYILEAHAHDEWPINYRLMIPQHRQLSDRIQAAQQFQDALSLNWPLFLDNMQNDFERSYAPWPVRFYIIYRGRMAYIAEPLDASFTLAPIADWITRNVKNTV